MTNLRDIITSPIDEAKDMITQDYFTETPCDAALIDFAKQFIVEHHGDWAKVSHRLHRLVITVSVSYERSTR